MAGSGKRGRPAVYVGEVAERIGKILTGTDTGNGANLKQARTILNARNGVVGLTRVEQAAAEIRRSAGFNSPLGVSDPTLRKVATGLGIKVRGRGRPAKVAVAA